MEKLRQNVTTRQLTLFFALLCPIAKLFIMPASYCYYAGKDCWIGVLIQGLIDVLCLFILLSVMKKDGRSLFEILSSAIGKRATKIIYFYLSMVFIAKAVVPILEQLLICYEVLYESTPKRIFFIPLFIAAFYASISEVNGIFRSIELFAPFIVFSIFGIGFLSLSSVELYELFPIFEFGVRPTGVGMIANLLWFGDYIVLLPLLDNVEIKGKNVSKILFGYIFEIVIVAAFLIITVGIFGSSAARQVFMLSKISKYSIAFSNLGRIDFLFIIVLFLGETIYSSILLALATKTLVTSTGLKTKLCALIVCATTAVFSITMLLKSYAVIEFLQTYSLAIFSPIYFGMPIALPIISRITRNNEKKLRQTKT